MIKNLTTILASGLAALFIAGASANEPTPPPQPLATAERADDGAITKGVQAALAADPAFGSADISIETAQGVVRLSGYVSNADDIQKAAALATGVTGVKSVKNELKSK